MIYNLEAIKYRDGREEPEILHVSNGDCKSLDDAKLGAKMLLVGIFTTTAAQAVQIRENGGPVIARVFPGP